MEGRKRENDCTDMLIEKNPKPQIMLLMLKIARLTCSGFVASMADSLCSRLMRSRAMYLSLGVRNLHWSGREGRTKNANEETKSVKSPSKKKMLRHEWMGVDLTPHFGIGERPAARRPPKAPASVVP